MISILLALAAAQTAGQATGHTSGLAPAQAGPLDIRADRLQRCIALVQTDPAAARAEAARWRIAGGRFAARECAGLAFAAEKAWPAAAGEFEEAARAAQLAKNAGAATYWAQAGNAWLAAADPAKARVALDSALTAGTLTGLPLGEAQLDHARALVATGDLESARTDIDLALTNAADDPLAWLLSATLARREGNPARAKKDIDEALRRSADDASVQLEAGNIAALAGDKAGARSAWGQAARLAPDTPVGRSAVTALRQFDGQASAPRPSAPIGR
jgi:predicted negative regulator of RcsB-dependent stress response